jgi:RNA polymerase sigma-70 factor (ECF subfamily)
MWPVLLGDSVEAVGLCFARDVTLPRPRARLRSDRDRAVAAESEVASANRELDQLMDRYARGEDGAFADLFKRGAPRVQRFLRRLCSDAHLVDDLTQETFLKLHTSRGRFELGSAALPWMLAVARNAFLDSTRRARVRRDVIASKSAAATTDIRAPTGAQGDEVLVAMEMARIVEMTLASMSVRLREAFVLVRFEGMSVAEAAQILGTTSTAVKVRAFRAYELLRAALGSEVGGKL